MEWNVWKTHEKTQKLFKRTICWKVIRYPGKGIAIDFIENRYVKLKQYESSKYCH
jgi:hypothetical protein